MKLSKATLNYILIALAGFCASTTNATCHVYFYQVGSSDQELWVEAYDHSDTSCSLSYSETEIKEGEWVSATANKNHYDTIQVYLIDNNDHSCDAAACGVEINSCDGSLQSKGGCSSIRKALCSEYYIIDVEDDNFVCEAATDDNGSVLTNESGDPYCATDPDDSDCKSITFPDWGADEARRALLRGANLRQRMRKLSVQWIDRNRKVPVLDVGC